MTTEKLTEKQKNILKIIKDYIDKKGYAPTVRELCDLSKLRSTSSVQRYLDKLESTGYITKEKDSPRTIRILKIV